ncbi:MAG: hypothetical protein U0941_13520 [Planctomycetaceae bacterium]
MVRSWDALKQFGERFPLVVVIDELSDLLVEFVESFVEASMVWVMSSARSCLWWLLGDFSPGGGSE